jgi:YegS/Rv2252/BmrU family lipid kinase
MRRRLLVILNPAAGQRRARRCQAVLAHLRAAGCKVEVRRTAAAGDAERVAGAARGADWEAVVAAGGDGTVLEVVNGLTPAAPPLAVLPLGTANVLAAEIGLPRSPRALARTLAHGPVQRVYPGRIGARRFMMMVGVGLDARTIAAVDPALKRLTGKGAYYWAAAGRLLATEHPLYDVTVDGVTRRAASVIVANGHYYAGRFVCAPEARLTDPEFHVCLFTRPGRWPALRYGLATMLGRLDRLDDYQVVRGRRIAISGPAGDPVQADGDLVARLPVEVVADGTPLDLIVPP